VGSKKEFFVPAKWRTGCSTGLPYLVCIHAPNGDFFKVWCVGGFEGVKATQIVDRQAVRRFSLALTPASASSTPFKFTYDPTYSPV
jgi:hypothetical protein